MLFTATHPARQEDRIVLFLDADDARAAADGRPIFGLNVGLDPSGRRLAADGLATAGDADWDTPAYFEDVRRIMARGPIPKVFFSSLEMCCPGF